jgi:hypothetical protein
MKIRIYKTIILSVVLYGYETLSLTLRVRKRIFGPQRDEVMGGWRKLHNELHNLYSSPHTIRMIKSMRMRWMRWTEHVARMGRRRMLGYWWESQKERDH